jgi:hypothetical protein
MRRTQGPRFVVDRKMGSEADVRDRHNRLQVGEVQGIDNVGAAGDFSIGMGWTNRANLRAVAGPTQAWRLPGSAC